MGLLTSHERATQAKMDRFSRMEAARAADLSARKLEAAAHREASHGAFAAFLALKPGKAPRRVCGTLGTCAVQFALQSAGQDWRRSRGLDKPILTLPYSTVRTVQTLEVERGKHSAHMPWAVQWVCQSPETGEENTVTAYMSASESVVVYRKHEETLQRLHQQRMRDREVAAAAAGSSLSSASFAAAVEAATFATKQKVGSRRWASWASVERIQAVQAMAAAQEAAGRGTAEGEAEATSASAQQAACTEAHVYRGAACVESNEPSSQDEHRERWSIKLRPDRDGSTLRIMAASPRNPASSSSTTTTTADRQDGWPLRSDKMGAGIRALRELQCNSPRTAPGFDTSGTLRQSGCH
jgi:hypothetical protein